MRHGIDGWILTPEGALLHPSERVAVIADVHLGYEWSRASGGDCLPAHSRAETQAKLASLLDRAAAVAMAIHRLVVAGDLVESSRPCRRTAQDLRTVRDWLDLQGIELVRLPGNHDPSHHPDRIAVAGWTIAHGHRPIAADQQILGHHHPVLRVAGRSAPCFLVSPTTIVLPAFSPNAAGVDVLNASFWPAHLRCEPLRCVASTGQELLDFGPVAGLADRCRAFGRHTLAP